MNNFWCWLTMLLGISNFQRKHTEGFMNFDFGPIEKAFKNTEYRWRTIEGIAEETHLTKEVIKAYIILHKDIIIKSDRKNNGGEDLYTTKELYRKNAPLVERVIAAFRNRTEI